MSSSEIRALIEKAKESLEVAINLVRDEHYDFALVVERRTRPAVSAFLSLLAEPETREALRTLGFRLSTEDEA